MLELLGVPLRQAQGRSDPALRCAVLHVHVHADRLKSVWSKTVPNVSLLVTARLCWVRVLASSGWKVRSATSAHDPAATWAQRPSQIPDETPSFSAD